MPNNPNPPYPVPVELTEDELLALARLLDQSGCVDWHVTDEVKARHPLYSAAQKVARAADDVVHLSRASRRFGPPDRVRQTNPEVAP